MKKAYFVTEITVIDPDSKGVVEIAMYKHENVECLELTVAFSTKLHAQMISTDPLSLTHSVQRTKLKK